MGRLKVLLMIAISSQSSTAGHDEYIKAGRVSVFGLCIFVELDRSNLGLLQIYDSNATYKSVMKLNELCKSP